MSIMGYSTDFNGEIKLSRPLTEDEIKIIEGLSDSEKLRDGGSGRCQWEVQDEKDSIERDGGEKFYDYIERMEIVVGYLDKWGVIANGTIKWQGEEIGDLGIITVQDNMVESVEMIPPGEKVKCPHCGEIFYPNSNK